MKVSEIDSYYSQRFGKDCRYSSLKSVKLNLHKTRVKRHTGDSERDGMVKYVEETGSSATGTKPQEWDGISLAVPGCDGTEMLDSGDFGPVNYSV